MKKCVKCSIIKDSVEYYKDKTRNDNLNTMCKICSKELNKQSFINNPEYYNNNSKQRYKIDKKNIRHKNNLWCNKRYQTDPKFRLIKIIRSRLYETLGSSRSKQTLNILGCSSDEFKQHIESQFEPWMNWDNQGNPKDGIMEPNKTWDVDHIIPISSAKTEDEIYKLNHYTNFQPLCAYNNRFIKRDKF